MAKEKLVRPDSGAVKSMIEAATRIDSKLQAVCASEEPQRRIAQEAAQHLFDDRVREALEQMDVEHINNGKQGIRVGLLRSSGVNNVWQASQLTYRQICDIDGLGEQSAAKIRDIIKQIQKNTKDTIRIRIRMDNPGKVDTDLIRALYVRIHARPLRQQARKLHRIHHNPLQQELITAKKALGGFGWLFKAADAKRQIIAAADSLQTRLEGEFGNGKLLGAWTVLETVSPDTCWADYQNDASAYYAELENLGLHWEKQDTAGGLPAQLAAEIEAQKLDLRYLKATLRSYQTFGTKYTVHQKKTLLGDEMGLGKTVQAIAAMAALAAEGKHHFMVVCPASVLINWCRREVVISASISFRV